MSARSAHPPFEGLPDLPAIRELQDRRQWVAWRYETRPGPNGPKETKPPVNPHTGFGASHSDPRTWGTYAEAADRARRVGLPGVGYVMSADDEYTGADLDKCRDPDTGQLEQWAADVVALAETYTEISPSGRGLRLIWRGKVEKTAKADPVHVEIYRDRRFLTITGNHLPGTPTTIQPAPRTCETLQARVDAWTAERDAARGDVPSAPLAAGELRTLQTSGRNGAFFRNVNTAALTALASWVPALFGPAATHQPGTGAWRVSSRSLGRDLEEDLSIAPSGIVDWGVHDMGDARGGKRSAVDLVLEFGGYKTATEAAAWLCDRLGRQPEDFGWQDPGGGGDTAHGAALAAALVQSRAVVETGDGTIADAETGEILNQPTEDTDGAFPAHLLRPPGLLGELTDWMTSCAETPSPLLNMAASLTLLGALFGRRYRADRNLRTNFYTITLAPSSFGKSHPMNCVKTLIDRAGLGHLLGGSKIKSDSGLRTRLEKAGSVIYLLDEFGGQIRPWLGGGIGKQHYVNIRDLVLTLFSEAGGVYNGEDYGAAATDPIFNPHLCIYGTTTPDDFWRSIEGGAVIDGFLARFILLDAGTSKPKAVADPAALEPPARLLAAVQAASGLTGRHNLTAHTKLGLMRPDTRTVPWGAGAQEMWVAERDVAAAAREAAPGDAQAILGRVAEHAQKLALVRAVGRNWTSPSISMDDLAWGFEIARHSSAIMVSKISDYVANTAFQADYLRVRRIIREHRAGLSRRDLMRKLSGLIEPRKLNDMLAMLLEAGDVETVNIKPTRGPSRAVYLAIRGPK